MQHTLLAVFDNRSDAEKALDALIAGGFPRPQLRLTEGESGAAQPEPAAHGIGAGIRRFFADIFGTDRSEHAQMYAAAVTSGRHVLSLEADTEEEVERAADIVERFGPVDIDEHGQSWTAPDHGLRQQSASMAQQSGGGSMQGAVQGGSTQGTPPSGSQQRAETTAIPVIQEELRVGKRAVERGGVRIYQRVVETPVSERVELREEHVNVARHPVDRPVRAEDLHAFEEATLEMRETGEEPVVSKTARVVEEVVVGKQVSERSEQVSDTVRRTEVEVEPLSAADDAEFRGHWTSNYGTAGSFEEYAPAYRYGSEMARSERYRGQAWNEVENHLRSDWEARHPRSAWDRFKAAVRHGWERIAS